MSRPIHPFGFTAFAIAFFVAHNRDVTTGGEAIGLLLLAWLPIALVLVVATLLTGRARKAAIVTSVLALLFFSFGHVAAITGASDAALAVIFVVVAVAISAVVARTKRRLKDATRVLNMMSVVMLAVVLVPLAADRLTDRPRASTTVEGITLTRPEPARDIYYLIFDRYADAQTLREHFGFDNRPFLDALEEQGFVVASRSRANYQNTHLSLASSLNMQHLAELTRNVQSPTNDKRPAFDLISRNAAGRLLKAAGYRYIHVGSPISFTARSEIADVNLEPTGDSEFGRVFRSTTALRALNPDEAPATEGAADAEMTLGQLDAIERTASMPGPKFVFSHVIPPHPPYVLDRDGNVVRETKRAHNVDGYLEQVRFVNARIARIVERLLAGPKDRDPIIVIQADEGPLPRLQTKFPKRWYTEPRGDVRVKFGILNAYHLPGEADAVYDTISPVNAFRVIFNRYFDADLELLPDESYAVTETDADIYTYVPLGDRVRGNPPAFRMERSDSIGRP